MSDAETVIQTEHLAAEAAAWMAQRCRLVTCPAHDPRFGELAAGAAGLVVRTYTVVNGALLDAAPRLRVVGRAGAGLDNIDVAACRQRRVEVVYTPDANTQAVVEFVVGRLTAAVREVDRLSHAVPPQDWTTLRRRHPDRPQLSEMTFGILGLGRIGRRLAEVAAAIGFARVLYNDLVEIPAEGRFGAEPVTAEALFGESDVVSVHVDGRPANRRFVDGRLLGVMRPQVIFINTSRGFVVDSSALAAFLHGHPRALAILDVHETEPFDKTYPLLETGNAWLTPHVAASTDRADLNMSWVVRDVAAVLEGRPPQSPAPYAV